MKIQSVFRKLRICVSLLLIGVAVPGNLSLLSADSPSGRFERYCDGVWFFLTKIDGLPASEKVTLFFRMPFPPGAVYLTEESWWWQVYAQVCSAQGQCEDATSAKMWLNKGASSGEIISGKYEIDFHGQHLQAQFAAKRRKPTKTRICE